MDDKPIGMKIHDVARLFDKYVEKNAQEVAHLNKTNFGILTFINKKRYKNIEVTQKDIATFFNYKASSISVALDNLEKRGYLKRSTGLIDSRVKHIFLTQEGILKVEEARSIFKKADKYLESALTEEELKNFYYYLNKMKEKMVEAIK